MVVGAARVRAVVMMRRGLISRRSFCESNSNKKNWAAHTVRELHTSLTSQQVSILNYLNLGIDGSVGNDDDVVDICCFDKTGSDDMMQCLDIKDPKEEDTLSALYYVVPSMQTNMETMYHIRTESQMNAKLSDFGVIREGPKDEPTHVSTMVESIKKISEYVAQLVESAKGVATLLIISFPGPPTDGMQFLMDGLETI
ncbi:hypothetical protein Tco_1320629 [Tanacetum coccineum]